MRAVLDADAVLIPFGGGTSISGSLEPPAGESRPVISLDLSRLSRVLDIDPVSRLARVQAGVLGPDLERQLAERGFTLGHFPDSFTHSTLGGWIATRSSGMQSDRYGDIAELTRAVRVVTPAGRARDAPGARDLDRPERARDGARQRGPARRHHRGHRPRPPAARRARHPRLSVPDLEDVAGGDARHRGERGEPVGHARVRLLRDRLLVRHPQGPDADGQGQVGGAAHLPVEAQGLRRRRDVPVVHRLRGDRAPRRRPAQADRQDRLQPRRAVHRRVTGRAL